MLLEEPCPFQTPNLSVCLAALAMVESFPCLRTAGLPLWSGHKTFWSLTPCDMTWVTKPGALQRSLDPRPLQWSPFYSQQWKQASLSDCTVFQSLTSLHNAYLRSSQLLQTAPRFKVPSSKGKPMPVPRVWDGHFWHISTIAGIYWIRAEQTWFNSHLICCMILGEWLPLWICLWHS